MYEIGKLCGVVTGIVIGLIICLIFFRLMNKNKRIKTDYDERQEKIRGVGYKIGFWTLSGFIGILLLLAVAGITLPVNPIVLYFFGFFVGAMSICVYSILKGAYFGTNNIENRWYIFMVIFAIFNFAIAIDKCIKGEMIVDGILEFPAVNFLCGLMFVTVFVTALIKKLRDKNIESEIDE